MHVGQYIFDHEINSWSLIGDIEIFKDFTPEHPIILPEVAKYYTYENLQVCGPYRKLEVIRRLDSQEINVFTYIYAAGEERWTRLKEHKDFIRVSPSEPGSEPSLKRAGPAEATITGFPVPLHMKKTDRENSEIKKWEKIRKFKRSPFSAPASVDYGESSFPGFVTEIGAGGCFIEFNWKALEKNDEVHLKIMPGIVSLKLDCRARAATFISRGKKGVGFEFINLSKEKGLEIKKFVEKFAHKLGG